ncbi:2-(1,2-epoxy-1,2-dihydrophenyl)acetyl-CoA isomerase PaaG [Sphingopyxis panaciterrulae]|uniref:2-(1,2-epoxy-1,2-dihydrophenyl)acetyl-CoA isomerase n=1 Tax=Sphingopyxis panaciterrulae TaxID=462372 RepID=A0A7W9B747_9SPHN|nr:2-(1,2-epoxy-1,2-dihydrophenyl)acetyl-CoA isomerase PaaG [Sphingopyxis panaciterrulae]MBB5707433.1 2-(1,2-epoxy-1,2-dihydrophenyl)acetyl-CoA isomerase [Sphingopyxis panaciterrulae]
MSYETIILTVTDGAYRLTLNRPDKLNSFNAQMHEEVRDALTCIERDADARVLLITGAGRGFCAGQDLGDRDVNAGPLDLSQGPQNDYNPLVRRLVGLPIPVVCAVNGVAAGAGVNIAAACDIVVATASAKFAQAFSAIGLVPDSGGTYMLPRLMGQARAMAFTLLNERLTAEQAAAYGLIWKAIPDDEFGAEVEAIIAKLAAAPTFGLGSAKRAIRESWSSDLDASLDRERDMQKQCGLSPDYREGVNAFKEKRVPEFTGAGPA